MNGNGHLSVSIKDSKDIKDVKDMKDKINNNF